jgi:hypothetical protein
MEAPPGGCGDWLRTATVTARASTVLTTRRTRGGDFYLATSEDFQLATHGDFNLAMDSSSAAPRVPSRQ